MVADYKRIAQRIADLSPGTLIHIIPDSFHKGTVMERLGLLPSITFSPAMLRNFKPPRGPIYSGQRIPKSEQLKLMSRAGIRVPMWTFLTADKSFTESEWGELVILKPNAFGLASNSVGVELVRTRAVQFVPSGAYPIDHPGRAGPMLVQQFIDTGDYSEDYRVITIFGKPLYAFKRISHVKLERPSIQGFDRTSRGVASYAAEATQREAHLCYDEDVLELASRVYLAIPTVPFQAVDMRRDAGSGHLFCLEINPGGNTWNFSSKIAGALPTIDGVRREDQFGAWEISAKALLSVAQSHAK